MGALSWARRRTVAQVSSQEVATSSTDSGTGTGSVGRSPQPKRANSPGFAYGALFGVALLWGSYTPALRYLFLADSPPSAAMLNAMQACLSAGALVASLLFNQITHKDSSTHPEFANPLMAEAAAIAAADTKLEESGAFRDIERPSNEAEHAIAVALNWKTDNLVLAGAELGTWTFLAFGLEVLGVEAISATKAAFLNQATVLITPLLVHLSGEHVRKMEWAACVLGLAGSLLVALDSGGGGGHGGGGAEVADNEALGVTYVLVSALFFAMSTVRLSRYSNAFPSLQLASASTISLATLSLGWMVAAILTRPGTLADSIASEQYSLSVLFSNPLSLVTLVWIGLGPGALAAFLQATGQQQVPPAQAQVIYATTPLFASGFAMVVLDAGDEAMGSLGWMGGAFMLLAAMVASWGGGGGDSGEKQQVGPAAPESAANNV